MNHPLPGANYPQLRKIIIAYSAFSEQIVTSSKLSAFLSQKITTNAISRNSDFFTEVGLLQRTENSGKYIVSDICKRLGEAFANEPDNEKEVSKIWKEIINGSAFFRTLIQRIEATEANFGVITKDELQENIISLSEYKDKNNSHHVKSEYSLAVIQILKAGKIITLLDNKTIKLYRSNLPSKFISSELTEEFRKIKIKKFSLSRLIHYCEQINDNYERGYYESVAFVTRALMDHVPPIFGQSNFENIGAQVKPGKVTSFKKSCDKLNNSLKHIADDLIHKQISAGVSPLIREEIDFSQDLNTFLRRLLEELKSIQSQEQ